MFNRTVFEIVLVTSIIYSNDDILQGTITTYHIQLVGDDTVYDTTTNTCYEFNVSLCNTFNVSVTASAGQYNSSDVVIPIDSELLIYSIIS